MRIVVCAKHVPDIQAERRFTADGRVDRGRGDGTVNEVDENALEEARRIAERLRPAQPGPDRPGDPARSGELAGADGDVEIVVVTMGPAPALDAVRRGLQMGADRGVHVCDDALAGSDVFATARVLGAAIRRIGDVDLVLVGMAALDSLTSLLPAALAEELDLPALTIASALEITPDGAARVRRELDDVAEVLESPLPALVSVTDGINSPRFPNFQAIMAARSKPVETWSLADLGIDAATVGEAAARTRVLDVRELPPRDQEVLDTNDDGGAGARLAEHLLARAALMSAADASPRQQEPSPVPGADAASAAGDHPVVAVLDVATGFDQAAAELITTARRVADGFGARLDVVWPGELDDDDALRLGSYGVSRVHRLDAPATSTTVLAESLVDLATRTAPVAFLATTSFVTRELAARLGARLGGGVLVDVTGVAVVDGHIEGERTSFAASWGSRCAVVATPAVVTIKPHSTMPTQAETPSSAEVLELEPGEPDSRVRVVERTAHAVTGRPDLASADVVVAGGRGTEGDFSLLEELAAELGAGLGATRVATDEGWVGHEMQIGQTGVTINPRIYIGAGISGAVHHVGGMRAAQHVVAINTDPDAPLVQLADYAVIGDLFDVVRDTLTRLRELRG